MSSQCIEDENAPNSWKSEVLFIKQETAQRMIILAIGHYDYILKLGAKSQFAEAGVNREVYGIGEV